MRKIKLSQCGNYVTKERINTNQLDITNYITTDNMLPNKEGICEAEKIPSNIIVNHFQENDILLSNIRPYFKKIWKARYDGGCSADVLVFRTNSEYNADFIKYCLSQDAFFEYDMKGAKGSKMPRGDKNHILNFELYDFPLPTQRNIASVLNALDDKIILNNKINQELEQMAKTLYDYWFVQFDFPDEKGRPYKSANGKMVYNEVLKREIPAGWEALSLENRLNFDRGVEFGSSEYIENPESKFDYIKFYRVGDMDNSGNTYISKYLPNLKLLKPYDLVVSFDGSVGRIANALEGAYSSGIRKITDKKGILDNSVLFLIMGDKYIQSIIQRYAVGSNILHASSSISHLFIPYNESVFIDFQNIITPIYKKIIKNKLEVISLTSLRDFLLPLLMNGQVTVGSEH